MEFIKAENLHYEYSKTDENGSSLARHAVKGVSFSIEKGSFTAVIGHNGSGKSTLAKNMNALLVPTEGRMLVNGMDTSLEENMWKVRQSVAMVFQNPDNQIVSSIVEDDVAFGPENLGMEPEIIRQRVDAALESVGMSDYSRKAPHMLSGGQKQRIAIAGAVAMEPECIVFDEPTAMLDPKGRQDVLDTIKMLNSRGITTILITHFMEEAAQADHVIVMHEGRIRMDAPPEEIFRRSEELMEMGLGVPAPVELAMELRKRGVAVSEKVMTADELIRELAGNKER